MVCLIHDDPYHPYSIAEQAAIHRALVRTARVIERVMEA